MQLINSKQNKGFKMLKSLAHRKYREKYGTYVLEGVKQITHGFLTGHFPEALFVMQSKAQSLTQQMEVRYEAQAFYPEVRSALERAYILTDELFSEISDTQNSQGMIGIYKILDKPLLPSSKNVLVLDRVQDPGNLGSIIRNADAFGFTDLYLVKGSADAYSTKVLRSAMGSFFQVNLYEGLEIAQICEILQKREKRLLLTDLKATHFLKEFPFSHADKGYALVLGNEGSGISPSWYAHEHEKIKIEMFGSAQSLNVAMASAILMYEISINEK